MLLKHRFIAGFQVACHPTAFERFTVKCSTELFLFVLCQTVLLLLLQLSAKCVRSSWQCFLRLLQLGFRMLAVLGKRFFLGSCHSRHVLNIASCHAIAQSHHVLHASPVLTERSFCFVHRDAFVSLPRATTLCILALPLIFLCVRALDSLRHSPVRRASSSCPGS